MTERRRFLRSLFDAAIDAVQASRCVPQFLPGPPDGVCRVFGAGKAAAAMAAAVESHWAGDFGDPGNLGGLVVVPYGHAVACDHIEVIEAAHPVPDEASVAAARRMLAMAQDLGPDDLALCLWSGGGSSVLCLPAESISLEQKQAATREMLRRGAPIAEINAARIKLSGIKGGRLANACAPAAVVTLVMSDVPGDDPSLVASGPSITGESGEDKSIHIVARARDALDAAWCHARHHDVQSEILGDALQGEARVMAAMHASIAVQVAAGEYSLSTPCVLLSGGEFGVTVNGDGIGGRNTEYLLALAIELQGHDGIWAMAADTDGIDGRGNNAGAFIGPDTLSRAKTAGLDAGSYLSNNDSYSFFECLDDLLVTGPTRVNVNDFRAILIDPPN